MFNKINKKTKMLVLIIFKIIKYNIDLLIQKKIFKNNIKLFKKSFKNPK